MGVCADSEAGSNWDVSLTIQSRFVDVAVSTEVVRFQNWLNEAQARPGLSSKRGSSLVWTMAIANNSP